MPGFFSALTLIVVFGILHGGGYPSGMSWSNSQSVRYTFPHLGLYRIHGAAPPGLETFYEFQLTLLPGQNTSSSKVDGKGNLLVDGAVFVKPAEFRPGAKIEQLGEISTKGEFFFVDVVRLKFKSAKLQLEGDRFGKISFDTEAIDGTSYSFEGRFLQRPRLENRAYVELTGEMRKLKHEQKQMEACVKFFYWAYE